MFRRPRTRRLMLALALGVALAMIVTQIILAYARF